MKKVISIICLFSVVLISIFSFPKTVMNDQPTSYTYSFTPLKQLEKQSTLLIEQIKNDYGVNVYVGVDPYIVNNTKDYDGWITSYDLDESHTVSTLEAISWSLNLFKEELLSQIPDIYIVGDMKENYAGLNVNFDSYKFIIVSGKYETKLSEADIIVHELFHALTLKNVGYKTVFVNYANGFENHLLNESRCSDISDYACTNSFEFYAELFTDYVLQNGYIRTTTEDYFEFAENYLAPTLLKEKPTEISIGSSDIVWY